MLEISINVYIVHSSAAADRKPRRDGPPRSVTAQGVRELPEGAVRAGTGEVIVPPEFVTVEHALRLDINHSTPEIDLWFSVGRVASQALFGRLAAREADLRARVVAAGGRVLPGPGDSSEASRATANMGVAQAFQLLRARISMFAQGRDGGEGV